MIKLPLNYFPVEIGLAKLVIKDGWFDLSYDKRSWMGLDQSNLWQADEFIIELKLAKGVCVTTGLGLGIIQTLLCQNEKVDKVIVYEKNKDIIDIFLTIVDKNNFDISKLEIKHKNADDITGEFCDCLFIDHFEGESEKEVLHRVKNIESNNTAKLLWYWPAAHHYILFVENRRKTISLDSYNEWRKYTGLNLLPEYLDDELIIDLQQLKEVYLKKAYGGMQQAVENFEDRNKLLKNFKKFVKKEK